MKEKSRLLCTYPGARKRGCEFSATVTICPRTLTFKREIWFGLIASGVSVHDCLVPLVMGLW